MKRLALSVVLCVVAGARALGGGGWHYTTDFTEPLSVRAVAEGHLPGRLGRHHGVYPLLVWLQLSGRYTVEYREVFRAYLDGNSARAEGTGNSREAPFVEVLKADGYVVGEIQTWRVVTVEELLDGRRVETAMWVHNCRPDAFRMARATYVERRARYGVGSVELGRWVRMQIAVFRQCGEDEGDPPTEPAADWRPLEQHDRRYQLAAWHFYRLSYLEAAARFRVIAQSADSPWQALARYLVPRSLARHAVVNEPVEKQGWARRPSPDRVRFLEEALAEFERLAAEDGYLVEFPSVTNQIMRIRTELDDSAFVGDVERRLIDEPSAMDPLDLRDYDYLADRWHTVRGRPEGYGRWLQHVTALADNFAHSLYYEVVSRPVDELLDAWRQERSLPYLYLALAFAHESTAPQDLRDLLAQSQDHSPGTPGYLAMLGQRLRVARILGDDGVVAELKSELAGRLPQANSRAMANEMRLQLALAASDWREYVQWGSLLPLDLPWEDAFARGLPSSRFHQITTQTRLFSGEVASLLNLFLTPRKLMDVLDAPALSAYQRSRLANAGWIKALLADDVSAAVELAAWVGRFAPLLNEAMARFLAADDKYFEAAWIVLKHPGFSPWVRPGIGRTQLHFGHRPASDGLGVSMSAYNWWCPKVGDDRERLASDLPYLVRDADLGALVTAELPTAAAFFGPHVIRYARENRTDPRIPEMLHRVVFATRYSCQGGPGDVSRGAFAILHQNYGDSEWTERTPYWYR